MDIADWHQGTRDKRGRLKLSSRKMLVLLEHMRDISAFKTDAERGGAWPDWMQILKELHKETALHRGSLYAGGPNEYEVKLFMDPVERREAFESQVDSDEESEAAAHDLYAVLGTEL